MSQFSITISAEGIQSNEELVERFTNALRKSHTFAIHLAKSFPEGIVNLPIE